MTESRQHETEYVWWKSIDKCEYFILFFKLQFQLIALQGIVLFLCYDMWDER